MCSLNAFRFRCRWSGTRSKQVTSLGRLGKKVSPGTFGKIKVGEREYPESPSVKQLVELALVAARKGRVRKPTVYRFPKFPLYRNR